MAPRDIIVFDTRPDGHGSLSTLPRIPQNGYETLANFYGFRRLTQHGYDRATNGQKYFGIYAIELKAGPAVFQPRVLNADNPPSNPAASVLVWNSWPGAEGLDPAVDPKYKATGVHCWTDATGSCGWGYGGGSHIGSCSSAAYLGDQAGIDIGIGATPAEALYAVMDSVGYTPNEDKYEEFRDLFDEFVAVGPLVAGAASGNCGVHTIWCNSGSGPLGTIVGSDALDRVGWWDDHITPNPWFIVDTKGGGTAPPPEEGDVYLVNIGPDGSVDGYVKWTPGTPIPDGSNGFLGLMIGGTVLYNIPLRAGSPF